MSKILALEINLLKQELKAAHEAKGMRASGDWLESVEDRTKGLSGSIWALDYTEYLEDGRKPGKFPPVDKIIQWIKDKNITPRDNISISSLAFLIGRKIATYGWMRDEEIYGATGGVNLVSEVITPARVQEIIDKVSDFQISAFTSDIKSFLVKMAPAQ